MIAQENIYTDKNDKIVPADSPEAAFLLAGKGTEIPKDVVKKYGLSEEAPGEKEEKPKPSANKSAAPTKNKGAK